MSSARALLMQHNVRKFYAAHFCHHFSTVVAILVLYFQALGLSYSQIGLVWAACTVSAMALELPSGILGDFLGRKVAVCLAGLAMAGAALVIGLSDGLGGVIVGGLLWGVSDAFFSGAEDALLYDSLQAVAAESEYLRVRSRLVLVRTAATILGSVAGGYLYVINMRLPWLVLGGANLVGCLIILTMAEPQVKVAKYNLSNQAAHLRRVLIFAWRNRTVRWLTAFYAVTLVPMYVFVNLAHQPYLVKVGYQPAELGFIFAVIAGVSGLIGSFAYWIEGHLGAAGSLRLMAICAAALFVLAGLVEHRLGVLVVVALYVLFDYQEIVLHAYTNRTVRSAERATLLSVQSLAYGALYSLLILPLGWIADHFSLSVFFFAQAVLVVLMAVPLLLVQPSFSEPSQSP